MTNRNVRKWDLAPHSLLALVLFVTLLISGPNTSIHAASAAGVVVGGPILSDTTWTLANSPYLVTENVQVLTGVTLTIQAGVVVKFNTAKLLQVDGTLVARGTAASPIIFTSNQTSPQKGDWGGIKFIDSSVDATFDGGGNYTGGCILEYCTVEYGGSGVNGAIETAEAAPLIEHCTVRNNNNSGIYTIGTDSTMVVIRHNTVSGNSITTDWGGAGGGIYAASSTVTDNTVSGNSITSYHGGAGGGIYAEDSTVAGNTVSGNSAISTFGDSEGGGIYAEDSTVTGNIVSGNSTETGRYDGAGGGIYAGNSTVAGNTVSGNSIKTGHYEGYGGGIYATSSTVISNTVSGNSIKTDRGGAGGGIYAASSAVTGNTVSGNSVTAYNESYDGAGGGIYVESSKVTSNTVSGNSVTAYNEGYGGAGGGIYIYAGYKSLQNAIVMSNTIVANRLSPAGQGAGVYYYQESSQPSFDFLCNTIVSNAAPSGAIGGIAIVGTPQFHYNNLYGNSNYDVGVLSTSDISGTNNYWGTVGTVDILAHIYDWYDNSSVGRLLYIPYLQDPDPNAPVPPPRNLRATFTDGSAILAWDPISSTATGYSYKVYYDDDTTNPPYDGTGATQGNSPISVGNLTQYTLSGLGSDTYSIAVTAYDAHGRESWYSNEINSLRRVYLPLVLRNHR